MSSKHTASRTLPACSLDLNSPASRRKAQRAVAQRIARRRMMQRNENEQAQDGSNVVHRTGIQHGDYDSISSYTQVEFLDQHDVVLGGTQDGCIDIVRLPRYRTSDNDTETSGARPMGTLMASKVSTGIAEPVYCLKSLEGGHSFVTGHRAGKFVVYATEHAPSYSFTDSATSHQASQQRLMDTPRLGIRSQNFESQTKGAHDDYPEYICSVERMLVSFGVGRDQFGGIHHFPGKPSSLFVNPRYEYAWDFRETPSCFMASFLERGTNSFSLSILDGRKSQHVSESVACIVGEEHALNNQYNPTVGHVTSTCFVSDHCLATLHMWQQPSREKSTTSVKIWDIRMATQKQKSTPVVENVLSPTVYDATGNVTTDSIMELDNQVKWASSPAQARLIPSSDDNGLFMASIVTNNDVAESYLLNACRASVVRKYRTRSAVQSTNAVAPTLDCLACYDSSSLSLYDFSEQDDKKKRSVGGDENRDPKGKKRPRDALNKSSQDLNDDCLIGTIAPTIEDEMGIRSRLSCLAFNKTGTSLVGGTDAVDLFLWRGG